MSPGRQEAVVVGIEERHVGARGGGEPVQLVVGRVAPARRHSCTSHRPITLRSSRIVPSTPRSLVRLYSRAGAVSTGSSSSRPSSDHVPEERIAARAAAERRRDERRRGVVARDRVHAARRRSWCASTGPSVVPASTGSPANGAAGSPSRSISVARPRARARVEQPGRRRVRDLVGELAAQPVREQVGHERDPLGRAGACGLVGQQLEDRVDRHRLDAGHLVAAPRAARARRRARSCRRCARRGSGTAARARAARRRAARSRRPRCRRRRRAAAPSSAAQARRAPR